MFILWSQKKHNNQHILCVRKTLDEIKQFVIKLGNKINTGDAFAELNLTKQNFNEFDITYSEFNFHYWETNDIDINQPVYIITSAIGEDCMPNRCYAYITMSNDKNVLMEKAEEYYISESKKTSNKWIGKMKTDLIECGYHLIPYTQLETYEFDIELKEFIPVSL